MTQRINARTAWLACVLLGGLCHLTGAPEQGAIYLAASFVIFGLSPEKPR